MRQRFYSNGKLFITGEYVVLDGANAFALPTKFGQDLVAEEKTDRHVNWISYDADETIWFQDIFPLDAVINGAKFTSEVTKTLVEILHEAHLLNPSFLKTKQGFQVRTHLTFPRKWGLGTSSTLVNNIAQWFGVDPFELLRNSFGGSGYDIACARSKSAVLYNLNHGNPITKEFVFRPEFHQNLYFVYLNQKQDSKKAIAAYKAKSFDTQNLVREIDLITKIAIGTADLKMFADSLEKHEELLSAALEIAPVKETLFSDFSGTVKSLGAWGGDFVLAVSESDPSGYFNAKGYQTVIRYHDMIL